MLVATPVQQGQQCQLNNGNNASATTAKTRKTVTSSPAQQWQQC
jgi:hypothetical protein